MRPGAKPDPTGQGEGGDLGGAPILLLCNLTSKRMMTRRRREERMMAITATVGAEEGERREWRAWGAGWTTRRRGREVE